MLHIVFVEAKPIVSQAIGNGALTGTVIAS